MISLDNSIIAALIIFLLLIIALNQLLFKPLKRIQAEREDRTAGLMARMKEKMDNQSGLFNKYQATIKNARMEGYRRQDELRAEAMRKRVDMLARARKAAEELMHNSRNSIQTQVTAAKEQLALESQEIARKITSSILERSAPGADSN
jgi:F-type H+-transporting ATPase subunit b